MSELELERIYTIPLRKVKAGSSNKAANRAVREVRSFLERHMKSEDVWLDDAVNRLIWARGMYKPPSKIRVRAVKFDDGVVEVSLPEEDATSSIRASIKEQRESHEPILTGVPEGGADMGLDEEPEGETDGIGEIEAEPEAAPEADSAAEAAPEETSEDDSKAAADADKKDA